MNNIHWMGSHMKEVGLLLAVFWSFYFMTVGGLWMMGFCLNGFCGMHFEIASCWQGLGAAVAAIPTVWAVIKGAVMMYHDDSELNTNKGEKP